MRVRVNNLSGTLEAALAADATTLEHTALAALGTIASPDIVVLTLDPSETGGAAEIVHITAHTSGATTATILREQEGTTARAHAVGVAWTHDATALDFKRTNELLVAADSQQAQALVAGDRAVFGVDDSSTRNVASTYWTQYNYSHPTYTTAPTETGTLRLDSLPQGPAPTVRQAAIYTHHNAAPGVTTPLHVGYYNHIGVFGGTVTDMVGMEIECATIAGTITSATGIRIDDGAMDGTTNWSIQSGAEGKMQHRGQVAFGGASISTAPAASASLDLQATDKAMIVNRLTTAQRDALTAVEGMVIYNTTTDQYEGYRQGEWLQLASADAADAVNVLRNGMGATVNWRPDGAVLRTTAQSYATPLTITGANATTNALTCAGHGRSTGEAVVFADGATNLPGGLATGVIYYLSKINTNTLTLSTTRERALGGYEIDLSSAGTPNWTAYLINDDTTPVWFMCQATQSMIWRTEGDPTFSFGDLGSFDTALAVARDTGKMLRLYIKAGWHAQLGGSAPAWVTGTTYEEDNRVTSAGSLWECNKAGSGTSTVAPTQLTAGADGYVWSEVPDFLADHADHPVDFVSILTGDANLGSYQARTIWPDDTEFLSYWAPRWLEQFRTWLDGTLADGTKRVSCIGTVQWLPNSPTQGEMKAGYANLYGSDGAQAPWPWGGCKLGTGTLDAAISSATASSFVVKVPNAVKANCTAQMQGGYGLVRIYNDASGTNGREQILVSAMSAGADDGGGAGYALITCTVAPNLVNMSRDLAGTATDSAGNQTYSGRGWCGTAGNNTHRQTHSSGVAVQFLHVHQTPTTPYTTLSSVSATAATPSVFTKTAHGFLTGDRVRINTNPPTGSDFAAWTNTTNYYVEKIDADTFYLASSQANAFDGTRLAATGSTSTATVRQYYWYHTQFDANGSNQTAIFFVPQANRFAVSKKAIEKAVDAGETPPYDEAGVAHSETAAKGAYLEGHLAWFRLMNDALPDIRQTVMLDGYFNDSSPLLQIVDRIAAEPGATRHTLGMTHLDSGILLTPTHSDRVLLDKIARLGFPLGIQYDGGDLAQGADTRQANQELLILYRDKVAFIEGPGTRFNTTSAGTLDPFLMSLGGALTRHGISMETQAVMATLQTDAIPPPLHPTTYSSAQTLGLVDWHAGTIAVTGTTTISLPQNSAAAIPIGGQIVVYRSGTNTVTIDAGTGATVISAAGTPAAPTLATRYASALCTKVAASTWLVTGQIT